ncbi:RNA-binding cell elongation regulator Jag/EloR [Kurthia senegalensis]|uniref:RNA-binding cell elongation regulator Jag/EloR n=1 Tax=Kurthia senegalensis TaxID=1033740 RepID=UPI000289F3B2|nr:RNA-binding cell elongation regulator Jag/EloR [Kurthia senegalensis]
MKQATQIGKTVEKAIQLALTELQTTEDLVDIIVIQQPKKGFFGFGAKKAIVKATLKPVSSEKVVDQSLAANDEQQQHVKTQLFESTEPSEVSKTDEDSQQVMTEQAPSEEMVLTSATSEAKSSKYDNRETIEHVQKYLNDIALGMGIEDLQMDLQEIKGKLLKINLRSKKAAVLIGKRGQTINALQQLTQLVVYKYTDHFYMVELDVENYRERREQSLIELANNMADKAIRTRKAVVLEPMPSSERKVMHHALAKRLDVDTYSEGDKNRRHLVIEPVL